MEKKKVKLKKKSISSSESKKILGTRERMLQRKKEMTSRGQGGGMIFPKEGTMRVRLMSQGPDKEIGLEVIQFYLDKDKGAVISPATFDEPCPFMEKYQELKNSSDEDDAELAKSLAPRRRYIVGGTLYKDEKGKEIDTDNVCKPILIPGSVYQDIIDLYLDEDDWGDMTDLDEGYDIKITRTGKGKNNTTYTVTACPGHKALPEKYAHEMDLEEIIKGQVKSYDELEDILNKFLNGSSEEEGEEDETPKKKKLKKKSKYDGDI